MERFAICDTWSISIQNGSNGIFWKGHFLLLGFHQSHTKQHNQEQETNFHGINHIICIWYYVF